MKGLGLKVGPLGEYDRLLTILSDEKGITRLAIPGSRRPRSSLAAATPLTFLELDIVGNKGLKKVKHIKVLKSFSKLGNQLETLAAAQTISELCLLLVPSNDPIPGMLSTVLIHLERLELLNNELKENHLTTLAKSVQACVHLLALGGYGIPIQECCVSGAPLTPPIGQWEWRCSFLPDEGFAIGSLRSNLIQLNPSELALLQRLTKANLPRKATGELMGPFEVWLKLLTVVELWISNNLTSNIRSIKMMREAVISLEDESQ